MTATTTNAATEIDAAELNAKHLLAHILRTANKTRNDANTYRTNAIAKMADGTSTYSSTIEQLIKAEAEINAWGHIVRCAEYMEQDGKTAQEIMAELERVLRRFALNTHHINSTSNIAVEQETMQRLAYVEAYNCITTGSIWG